MSIRFALPLNLPAKVDRYSEYLFIPPREIQAFTRLHRARDERRKTQASPDSFYVLQHIKPIDDTIPDPRPDIFHLIRRRRNIRGHAKRMETIHYQAIIKPDRKQMMVSPYEFYVLFNIINVLRS